MPRSREEKQVRLSMTGEEFKTLIEGITENGKIDTVPELMQQANEVSELSEEMTHIAEEFENVATNDDIEDMFNHEVAPQQPIVDEDGDGIDDSEVAQDNDIEDIFR